jgi:hypothetical protein
MALSNPRASTEAYGLFANPKAKEVNTGDGLASPVTRVRNFLSNFFFQIHPSIAI